MSSTLTCSHTEGGLLCLVFENYITVFDFLFFSTAVLIYLPFLLCSVFVVFLLFVFIRSFQLTLIPVPFIKYLLATTGYTVPFFLLNLPPLVLPLGDFSLFLSLLSPVIQF